MKLYDTLTRQTAELKPINPPRVTFYSCGPTVYDHLQIGNWLAFIRWDLLARTLRINSYDVDWVMNITDVGHLVSDADEGEDKLEKGAKREGKTAWEVAEYYTKDFLHGLDELNITVPREHLPRATDHIPEQIQLIKTLEVKGYTYVIDDGVYFDTEKLKDYGKLAGLKHADLQAGARVEFNAQKKNITDFALWKFSPKNAKRDMEWESPWGTGFPGWHLECSAMSMKYLGETIDLHAGGIDHIPVHHTNEIAQSETATGQPLANIWLHSNFLTVDGVKLSKSLGNSYTLKDLAMHKFTPLDFRMFVLQSHYRNETNFTWEGMTAARNRLDTFRAMADLRYQYSEKGQDFRSLLKTAQQNIITALQNDLHTPEALAVLSELESQLTVNGIGSSSSGAFDSFIEWLDELLGLNLGDSLNISDEQKDLIAKREAARERKDFDSSDALRDQLSGQGLTVRDTQHGQLWSRSAAL